MAGMADVAVLVPAGGLGTRLGTRVPKQFLRLGRDPILVRTVRELARHPRVTLVVVAVPRTEMSRARRLLGPLARRRPVSVVEGGATRQESVRRGLEAVPRGPAIVVVHDAVRPFLTRALMDRVLVAAEAMGAAICALPIAETVKQVREGVVEATLDRSRLWAVQTPQAFRTELLREAHDKARRDGFAGTDDAVLVERLGQPVAVVAGSETNVKITTAGDLRRARAMPRR